MFIWARTCAHIGARTCAHIGAHIWSAGLEKGRFDFCKGIGRRLSPVTPWTLQVHGYTKTPVLGPSRAERQYSRFPYYLRFCAFWRVFFFFWRVKIGPLFRFLKMRKFRPCNYRIVQFEFKCPTPNIIIMKFSPRTYDLTRK